MKLWNLKEQMNIRDFKINTILNAMVYHRNIYDHNFDLYLSNTIFPVKGTLIYETTTINLQPVFCNILCLYHNDTQEM